ncbi:MAG: O-antigen ligase family protein [Nanoarchaeota archaeon]|nr:O-antigen ligase family protein [Nanoarchaeota archaeon]MBU1005769.1 O-antigen ligase family protein [Nanoarchaeota archaeon]MBU1946640.1 O-antigen ligase family protein [Nanoarchaeota archaeon]
MRASRPLIFSAKKPSLMLGAASGKQYLLIILLGILTGVSLFLMGFKLFILAAICVSLMVVFVIEPWIGLMALIFVIPLERFLVFPEYSFLSPMKLLVIAVFASWIVHMGIYGMAKPVKSSQNIILMSFAVLCLLPLFFMIDISAFLGSYSRLIMLIGLFFMITNIIKTKRRLEITLWVVVISVFVGSLIGVVQSLTGYYLGYVSAEISYIYGAREIGGLFSPNTFALAIAASLPILIYFLLNNSSKGRSLLARRIALFVILFINVAAIFFSKSRSGFIGICIVAFLALFGYRGWLYQHKRLTSLMVLSIILVFLLFVPASYINRVLSLKQLANFRNPDSIDESSLRMRVRLQEVDLKIFLEHPMLGVGLGNFGHYAVEYNMGASHAHNSYLTVAVETGIFGLLLFLLFLLNSFNYLRMMNNKNKNLSGIRIALKISLIIICISLLYDFTFLFFYLWVFSALILSLKNIETPLKNK